MGGGGWTCPLPPPGADSTSVSQRGAVLWVQPGEARTSISTPSAGHHWQQLSSPHTGAKRQWRARLRATVSVAATGRRPRVRVGTRGEEPRGSPKQRRRRVIGPARARTRQGGQGGAGRGEAAAAQARPGARRLRAAGRERATRRRLRARGRHPRGRVVPAPRRR